MIRVALKPKWIALLIFVLAVASAFAWLGKWQLERAVLTPQNTGAQSEVVKPLTNLLQPGTLVDDSAGGHMVTAQAALVPGSFTIASGRLNQGQPGFWLIARAVVNDGNDSAENTAPRESTSAPQQPVSLAIALGWAQTREQVDLAAIELASTIEQTSPTKTFTGRFMPSEAPDLPANPSEPFEQQTVSLASLINQWPEYSGVAYEGYLIEQSPAAGLTKIDSFAPVDQTQVNWLNIFYSIEWAVFALFAVYIWWRMVRDDWQREQEDADEAASAATENSTGSRHLK